MMMKTKFAKTLARSLKRRLLPWLGTKDIKREQESQVQRLAICTVDLT